MDCRLWIVACWPSYLDKTNNSGDDTTLEQKTKQIQDIAGKLELQLQMLLNKFNVKRDELSST